MTYKTLCIFVLLLSGCSQSNPFLHQFKDKGDLLLHPLCTMGPDMTTSPVSMIQLGDYIVWNSWKYRQGTVLLTYHIKDKTLTSYKDKIDSTENAFPQQLFKLDDRNFTSYCRGTKSRTDFLIQDSLKRIATHSLCIRDKDSFSWLQDIFFSACYPTDTTAAYFIAQTARKYSKYGVYEQASHYFYPSSSCDPPAEEEMPLVSPNFWNTAHIIKQKNKNRFAIFRTYYQLFDLIEVDQLTVKPLKRSSTPHTLLTFQDQQNLDKILLCHFFPGLSVESENYIITVYQTDHSQYLLYWDWEGRPQYRFCFPKDYEITGLCGNDTDQIYALGISPDKQFRLFSLTVKDSGKIALK